MQNLTKDSLSGLSPSSARLTLRTHSELHDPGTYFFLDLGGGGGGGGGGEGAGAGGTERPLLPSFRGRPRGRLSGVGLVAAALAS